MSIRFHYSEVSFQLINEDKICSWIQQLIESEKKVPGDIVYHFVNEEQILEINQLHLSHDYFTDIITFDNSFVNIINGEIFISIPTVQSNAIHFNTEFLLELHRVVIHGVLHLCGYKDNSDLEKIQMRKMENHYLSYLEEL